MARASQKLAEYRKRRALELKLQGRTHEFIGEELGITASGVTRILDRILKSTPAPDIEDERKLARARLERARVVAWKVADQIITDSETGKSVGPTELQLKALDRIIKIEERQAKLDGMDAPTKFEGETTLTTTEAVMSALDALAGVKPTSDDDQGQ